MSNVNLLNIQFCSKVSSVQFRVTVAPGYIHPSYTCLIYYCSSYVLTDLPRDEILRLNWPSSNLQAAEETCCTFNTQSVQCLRHLVTSSTGRERNLMSMCRLRAITGLLVSDQIHFNNCPLSPLVRHKWDYKIECSIS